MKTAYRSRFESFLSLDWYEVALRFLFSFVAKTSEVLLAAGLVVSTANFLTDGSLLATYPNVSVAWAWAQALAIDSSLGVSLASTFQYLKQGAWIKGLFYGLLTLLLAGVAGAITTVDIVGHALHITTSEAMIQMSLNISIVSRLRAIAVIGFVLMSRLRDMPSLDLSEPEDPDPQLAPARTKTRAQPSTQAVAQSLLARFSAQEVVQIINACVASGVVKPAHVQGTVPQQGQNAQQEHGPQTGPQPSEKAENDLSDPGVIGPMKPPSAPRTPGERESEQSSGSVPVLAVAPQSSDEQAHGSLEEQGPGLVSEEELSLEREQRLEQAYQSLVAEGKKPSGRALAERVHIHRATCVAWLREKQRQKNIPMVIEESQGNSESVSDMSVPPSLLDPLAPIDDVLGEANNASPGVSPASLLPEDTPLLEKKD